MTISITDGRGYLRSGILKDAIGVYEIWGRIGGLFVTYVGGRIRLHGRRKQHVKMLKRGTHHSSALQRCYDRGVKFRFRIIDTLKPSVYRRRPQDLTDIEQYYMDTAQDVGILLNASTCARTPMRDPRVVEKVSAALIGRVLSAKTCARISRAKQGHPSWNAGISPSQSTRDKIAATLVGREGHKHTEEHKVWMSEQMRGANNPMYGLTGAKSHWYGRHHSEESKAKSSATKRTDSNTDAAIIRAYKTCGSIKGAARALNMSATTASRRLRKHKIIT